MGKYYAINAPAVISEPMEDELVVINLDNGCYYNLNKTAAHILNYLEKGHSLNEIASHAAGLYPGDAESISADFENFTKRLMDEQLVIEVEGATVDRITMEKVNDPSYQRPDFEKYSDMQEMLLLDPIHEVSEAGWPHQKKEK